MNRRRSFTLIEMLLVVAIIAVLSGLIFKMIQLIARRANIANCIEKLELVQHCLEEYHAEYGLYPPVPPDICVKHGGDCRICYEYESPTNQTEWLRNQEFTTEDNADPLFRMGLVAYIDYRERSGVEHTNNKKWIPDTQRDLVAKGRWRIFLTMHNGSSVIDGGGGNGHQWQNQPFTNTVDTIADPWGSVIHYICNPPYQSYKLWSNGPDKTSGNDDDVHRDKWDN